MIRVGIADDHQLFSQSLKQALELKGGIEVAWLVMDGKEALYKQAEDPADIVLADWNMPQMNGGELMRAMEVNNMPGKMIVLSSHNNVVFIKQALANGAEGYLLKSTSLEQLCSAIETVADGGKFFDEDLTGLEHIWREEPKLMITDREITILRCVARDLTVEQMASELNLSTHTVKTHRKNLISKLGLNGTSGLIRYALENSYR